MKHLSEPFASGERARLKKRVQIGYAAADIGVNAVELAIRLYLLIFYTDKVGLSPSLAGVALGIGLMIWIFVQVNMIGGRHILQYSYFMVGVIETALSFVIQDRLSAARDQNH